MTEPNDRSDLRKRRMGAHLAADPLAVFSAEKERLEQQIRDLISNQAEEINRLLEQVRQTEDSREAARAEFLRQEKAWETLQRMIRSYPEAQKMESRLTLEVVKAVLDRLTAERNTAVEKVGESLALINRVVAFLGLCRNMNDKQTDLASFRREADQLCNGIRTQRANAPFMGAISAVVQAAAKLHKEINEHVNFGVLPQSVTEAAHQLGRDLSGVPGVLKTGAGEDMATKHATVKTTEGIEIDSGPEVKRGKVRKPRLSPDSSDEMKPGTWEQLRDKEELSAFRKKAALSKKAAEEYELQLRARGMSLEVAEKMREEWQIFDKERKVDDGAYEVAPDGSVREIEPLKKAGGNTLSVGSSLGAMIKIGNGTIANGALNVIAGVDPAKLTIYGEPVQPGTNFRIMRDQDGREFIEVSNGFEWVEAGRGDFGPSPIDIRNQKETAARIGFYEGTRPESELVTIVRQERTLDGRIVGFDADDMRYERTLDGSYIDQENGRRVYAIRSVIPEIEEIVDARGDTG